MQTITVSATHARNNFFEILNLVQSGREVIVEKDKVEIAVISAKKAPKTDLKGLDKAMKAIHGMAKDFDLNKSPLRGKRSREWLNRMRNY